MSNKSYYSAQFNLFGYPHFQVETWYSLAIPKYWTSMKMCLIKKNRAVQRIALFYISQLRVMLQYHFVGLVLYDNHILAIWHSDHMIADGTSKRPYQSTRKVRHRDHRLLT